MFLIGISHAYFDSTKFQSCLKERYFIEFNPEKDAFYYCNCYHDPDEICVTPSPCDKFTPDDLSRERAYTNCMTDADTGFRLYQEYKYSLEHESEPELQCKKAGEVPTEASDECCPPMITDTGKPCDRSITTYSCYSHSQCRDKHEGRDYVCCDEYGTGNPQCILNHKCPKYQLYSA